MTELLQSILGYDLWRSRNQWIHKMVFLLLSIAILIGISSQAYRIDLSAGMIAAFVLFYGAYNLLNKKYIMGILALITGLPFLISCFLYPYYSYAGWLMIIPLLLFFVIVKNWKSYKLELPNATVITLYASYLLSNTLLG